MKSTLRWCGGSVPPVRREMASWLWHLCIRLCFHACAKGVCVPADLLVILRVHLRLCTPFACRRNPDHFTRKGCSFASVTLATGWAANQPRWGPSRLLSQCHQVKQQPDFLWLQSFLTVMGYMKGDVMYHLWNWFFLLRVWPPLSIL